MQMLRSLITAIALMALSAPGMSADPIKVKIRDSWVPGGASSIFYYAYEKGIFAKHGLDVTHEDGNGSTVTVQLVATKQVEVGHGDLSAMAIGRGKGMKVISIGGLMRGTALGIFVPKGSGLKTVKDLEGKEILYTATSFEGPFMDAILKAGGTSREKVNLVSLDATSKVSTYNAGRGTGMVTTIPYGTSAVSKARPSDVIRFSDYGMVLPSYGLIVHEDTIREKPEMLRRLVAAYFEAWTSIISSPAEIDATAQAIIKRRPDAKIDAAQIVEYVNLNREFFYTKNTTGWPLGVQSDLDWASTIKAMEEAKLLKPGTKPAEYFTNAFFK
jgi:NitT/TauT family transport system substrate-binding protein